MRTKVTFENEGEVTEMQVKDGSTILAYAEMNDGGAYVRTIYPYEGHDGIQVKTVGDICQHLEQLPFVEYAKFNYKP